MKDRPAGQPDAVPAGILICGSPPTPAMHVNRMVRTRNNSSASPVASTGGAIEGAVGKAMIVPGGKRARMWVRAAATVSRD